MSTKNERNYTVQCTYYEQMNYRKIRRNVNYAQYVERIRRLSNNKYCKESSECLRPSIVAVTSKSQKATNYKH